MLAPPSPQSPGAPLDGAEGRSSSSSSQNSQSQDPYAYIYGGGDGAGVGGSTGSHPLPSSSHPWQSSSSASLTSSTPPPPFSAFARQSSDDPYDESIAGGEVIDYVPRPQEDRGEGEGTVEVGDGSGSTAIVGDDKGGGGGTDGLGEMEPSSSSSSAVPSSASLTSGVLRPPPVVSPSHLRRGSISRQLYLDEELLEDTTAVVDEVEPGMNSTADSAEAEEASTGGGGSIGGEARPRLHARSHSGMDEQSRNSYSSESSSGLSSPVHVERRVDVSDAVKLSSILSMQSRKLENRFLKDFVPVPPPHVHVDTLVAASLAQFSKSIVQVVREVLPYRRYQPRKIRLLDYEVDEAVKAKARLDQAKDSGKKSSQLQDLFKPPSHNHPDTTADATANGTFAPSSSSSSQSASSAPFSPLHTKAYLDLDDGRYEDLGGPDDLIDLSLFSVTDDDVAASIKREQTSGAREGLFWRFSPEFEWNEGGSAELVLVKRQPVAFWTSSSAHAIHFLLSVQSLRFGLGNVEPLFCSLALYDLKTEEKCSEDFHFDLNDPSLLTNQTHVESTNADPLTLCKHAVFSLTEGHVHDLVMCVLKVERVLQGDPAEMEVYLKTKPRTAPELAALAKKSRQNLIHLSEYRQPFAWGMFSLFDSQGDLRTPHGSVRMDRLYLQTDSLKDDLFITMAREAHQDGGRKQRLFPSSYFECRLDELSDSTMPANRVDPSCIPLKNSPHLAPVLPLAEMNVAVDGGASAGPHHHRAASNASLSSSASPPICKEVLDFTTSTLPIPANGFVNLLYVYPESIRFDKFRNIACRVQIRSSDSHVDPVATSTSTTASSTPSLSPTGGEVLKLIMGKSSSSSFTTSALTQVNYHKKAVTPQDEIKIMLPLHLTPTFHLFFTFYKYTHTLHTLHTHTSYIAHHYATHTPHHNSTPLTSSLAALCPTLCLVRGIAVPESFLLPSDFFKASTHAVSPCISSLLMWCCVMLCCPVMCWCVVL